MEPPLLVAKSQKNLFVDGISPFAAGGGEENPYPVNVPFEDTLTSLYDYGLLPPGSQPGVVCGYCLGKVDLVAPPPSATGFLPIINSSSSSNPSPQLSCGHGTMYHKECLESHGNACQYCRGGAKFMGNEGES